MRKKRTADQPLVSPGKRSVRFILHHSGTQRTHRFESRGHGRVGGVTGTSELVKGRTSPAVRVRVLNHRYSGDASAEIAPGKYIVVLPSLFAFQQSFSHFSRAGKRRCSHVLAPITCFFWHGAPFSADPTSSCLEWL